MQENDIRALMHGLSPIPPEITPATTFPLAYWKTAKFAEVVSLGYVADHEDIDRPTSWTTSYEEVDGEWRVRRGVGSGQWGGAQGPPGSVLESLDKVIRVGMHRSNSHPADGEPGVVVMGWSTPEVAFVSLVQGSGIERSEARGHYGAWIIGSQRNEYWTVEAYDVAGHLLASEEGPRPREAPVEVIEGFEADQTHSSGGRMRIVAIERYESKVAVSWEFIFPADTASLLSAEDESEIQEQLHSRPLDTPSARVRRQEEWRRLKFVLGLLSISDDRGTRYEQAGGGGGSSGALAKWTNTFIPQIPEEASILFIQHGDLAFRVPLP
jgi:hypothetical protein